MTVSKVIGLSYKYIMANSLPSAQHYRRPIGLLEAILADRLLSYYKDLVLLQSYTFFSDMEERGRLSEKYKNLFNVDEINPRFNIVNKEINRVTARVHGTLRRVNAPTRWSSTTKELEYDFEKRHNVTTKNKHSFDVIIDRQYPQYTKHRGFDDLGLTIPMLEQSIGLYKAIWHRYWMRLLNPIWWIAFVARLPISLMEYMGINTETESINRFIYWLVQALMVLILSIVALKLGIKVNFSLLK